MVLKSIQSDFWFDYQLKMKHCNADFDLTKWSVSTSEQFFDFYFDLTWLFFCPVSIILTSENKIVFYMYFEGKNLVIKHVMSRSPLLFENPLQTVQRSFRLFFPINLEILIYYKECMHLHVTNWYPVLDHEFHCNIIKACVDSCANSRVDQ